MALTDSINRVAPRPHVEPPARHATVIPFPPSRGLLQVTLPLSPTAPANAQLRALLHSPLGVYVVSTDVVRGEVRAQLDIAMEDLDFTLHTLITLVPVATIGRLQRRHPNGKAG